MLNEEFGGGGENWLDAAPGVAMEYKVGLIGINRLIDTIYQSNN
jgi:hypothetical protein